MPDGSHHRFSPAVACVLAATALALAPLPAFSQDAVKWDQRKVTELAVELAVSVRDLRNDVRRIRDDHASTQLSRHSRLVDTLRVLENETRFLAFELEAGLGFVETLPVAKRVNRLIDRAAADGRRLSLPAELQNKIDLANVLMDKLRPFYREFVDPADAPN